VARTTSRITAVTRDAEEVCSEEVGEVWLAGAEEVWLAGAEEVWLAGAEEVWLAGAEEVWLAGAEEVWLAGAEEVWLAEAWGDGGDMLADMLFDTATTKAIVPSSTTAAQAIRDSADIRLLPWAGAAGGGPADIGADGGGPDDVGAS